MEYKDIINKLHSVNCHEEAEILEKLRREHEAERHRHDRLQDYDVSRAEDYHRMTIERNMLARKLREAESALHLVKERPKHWKMVWHKSHTNSQQSCKLKMVCPDCGAVLPYKQPVTFDFCPCCGKPKVYPAIGGMAAEVEEA